ncbi:MAG: hypothetical protein IPI67_36010 [Myxococcales bacterium]|nr:hypothetical protein [Myxococcales bacterium]
MAKTKLPPDLHPKKTPPDADSAIREANAEIDSASRDRLELPVTVLIRQRDQAIRDAHAATTGLDEQLAAFRREQDQFVETLMREHEARVIELEARYSEDIAALRKELLSLNRKRPTEPGLDVQKPGPAREELLLREQLTDALSTLELSRAERQELREELDAAAVAYDDMRQEMWNAVVAARDEGIAQKSKADELSHSLEDEKSARAAEARELQAELARLRAEREAAVTEARNTPSPDVVPTKPPEPTAPYEEVERAKEEAHVLRMELIETKRSLSRRSQELSAITSELRRSRRPTHQMPLVQSAEELEQRSAQAAEIPGFQRFMKRRERVLGTYSDGGGVDVVAARSEAPPPSSKSKR